MPRLRWVNASSREAALRVESWLADLGYDIERYPHADDSVVVEDKQVTLSTCGTQFEKTCTLLHESGHVLVYNARKRGRKKERRIAGSTLRESYTLGSSRAADRISIINEEVEAWDRGERLGARLSIRIHRPTYIKIRSRCLMSYVRWAVRSGRKLRQ